MRRWAVLAILTYLKYVPVAVLRPPSLTAVRYARDAVANTQYQPHFFSST